MDEPTHESSSSSSRSSPSTHMASSEEAATTAHVSSSSWPPADYLKRLRAMDLPHAMPDDRSVCEGEDGLVAADDNGTQGSVENRRNEERLAQLRQFGARVVALTRECIFEFGFENELDCFLRESLAKNAMATKQWLNDIFLKHFKEVPVVVGVLRAIAHLEYLEIYPTGPTMALAALSHRDVEVRDCAIRAFENWESPEGLAYLRLIRCEQRWLQDYLERVIADLDKRRQDVAAGAEN